MTATTDAVPACDPLDTVAEIVRGMKADLAEMIAQLDAQIAEGQKRAALLAEQIAKLEQRN